MEQEEVNEEPVEGGTNATQETMGAAEEEKPVLYESCHCAKAIEDPKFFELFPQFQNVKAKVDELNAAINSRRGCMRCKRRKMMRGIEWEFYVAMCSLDKDAGTRIKEYFGVKRMVVSTNKPDTNEPYLKEI